MSVTTNKLGPVSAYAIAVEHGFRGTEAEWLESLHPTKEQVDDVLSDHPEWTTTVQDGAITGIKIAGKTKVWRNVADFVPAGGNLTSDTIAAAFAAALDDGDCLYIPDGDYTCNLTVDKDCTIVLGRDCILRTGNDHPAILCEDCSVSIYNGTFNAGSDYIQRNFVYDADPDPASLPEVKGIIALKGCHDCLIYNIKSTNSNYPTVVQMVDCDRVTVDSCSFANCVNSFVFIGSSAYDPSDDPPDPHGCITVKNCRFVNSVHRIGVSWCYAVYTGGPMSSDVRFMPPDGLVYENNYVYNTEDCGLDTHGATNVVIRNNIVLQTVCALTAYNDNGRVIRPDGWKMHNIVFDNNRCVSDKSPLSTNPMPEGISIVMPHAFLYSGADSQGSPEIYADYYACENVKITNNYLKSPTSFATLVYLSSSCANVHIENNIFDRCGESKNVIYFLQAMGFYLANNTFLNCPRGIFVRNSYGTIDGNIGLKASRSDVTFSYVKGLENSQYGQTTPALVAFGDRFYRSGRPYKSLSYGIGYVDGNINADIIDQSAVVENGICTVASNSCIPGMSIKLTSGGTVIYGYVSQCYDFKHYLVGDQRYDFQRFSVASNSSIPDGTYTISVRRADIGLDSSLNYVAIINGQIDAKEQPDWSSATVATLAEGTYVLVDAAGYDNSYYPAYIVVNGALVRAYVLSTHLPQFYSDNEDEDND